MALLNSADREALGFALGAAQAAVLGIVLVEAMAHPSPDLVFAVAGLSIGILVAWVLFRSGRAEGGEDQ